MHWFIPHMPARAGDEGSRSQKFHPYLPHGWQEPRPRAIPCRLPGGTEQEIGSERWNSSPGTLMQDVGSPSCSLTCSAAAPAAMSALGVPHSVDVDCTAPWRGKKASMNTMSPSDAESGKQAAPPSVPWLVHMACLISIHFKFLDDYSGLLISCYLCLLIGCYFGFLIGCYPCFLTAVILPFPFIG